MFTTRRVLVLAGLALLLGFASVGFSGDAVYQAKLAGVDEYAQAYGRAVWTADPRKTTLEVSVFNCIVPDLPQYRVSVVLDGTTVGNLQIARGSGSGVLTISPSFRPHRLELFLVDGHRPELLMKGNFAK
jgi:hypothetical protein